MQGLSRLFFPLPSIFNLIGGSWIRLPAIAYSAHVSTTLVPVLAHVLFGEDAMGEQALVVDGV